MLATMTNAMGQRTPKARGFRVWVAIVATSFTLGMNVGLLMYGGNECATAALQDDKHTQAMQPTVLDGVDGRSRQLHQGAESSHRRGNGESPSAAAAAGFKRIRFVFVMGLEGTGHHLLSKVVRQSPTTQVLRNIRVHPADTEELSLLFFNEKQRRIGLFSSMCLKGMRSLEGKEVNMNENVDLAQNRQSIVAKLQEIVRKGQSAPDDTMLNIPINTWGVRFVGEMSYPNYGGNFCQNLMYPNIDLFYDACGAAGVECNHVYLYRDPREVLYSTTVKRKFQPSVLDAIHGYTSLLDIMYAQLSAYSDRTLGCMNFFADEGSVANDFKVVQGLFGWPENVSVDDFMGKFYKRPEDQDKAHAFVPPRLDPALRSFEKSYHRNIEYCRAVVAEETTKS